MSIETLRATLNKFVGEDKQYSEEGYASPAQVMEIKLALMKNKQFMMKLPTMQNVSPALLKSFGILIDSDK